MLNLAQKVYLASLARKEAAMPWEDDSALPEILAGVGGAGATAGAVYGPRAYAKLNDKLIDRMQMKQNPALTPAKARLATRAERRIMSELVNALSDADKSQMSTKEKVLLKAIGLENRVHRGARKYDVGLHKLFGKAGIKGKYSKAAATAALASLVGGGAAGIAHLLDK